MFNSAYINLDSRIKKLEKELNKQKGFPGTPLVIERLESVTVGVGGAASIDFQNIPSAYFKLIIDVYGRGDTAATSVSVKMTFNNDGSALYDVMPFSVRHSATVSSGEGIATTFMTLYSMCAANAPADVFDLAHVEIPAYSNTNGFKTALALSGRELAATTGNLYASEAIGWYKSKNAISRVTLTPSAGNFAQYSLARLYGVY